MADTKRSREKQGKNKEAARRRRDIERARGASDDDLDYEELLEDEEAEFADAEGVEELGAEEGDEEPKAGADDGTGTAAGE